MKQVRVTLPEPKFAFYGTQRYRTGEVLDVPDDFSAKWCEDVKRRGRPPKEKPEEKPEEA